MLICPVETNWQKRQREMACSNDLFGFHCDCNTMARIHVFELYVFLLSKMHDYGSRHSGDEQSMHCHCVNVLSNTTC